MMYKWHIPQIVPPSWCMSCDVCCHFPEHNSFLAPYFTQPEIRDALERGLPKKFFEDLDGGKIRLVPFKEGFICPAYDPHISRCTIYEIRPIDCRLYPFALMGDKKGDLVILGVDEKCPFIMESRDEPYIKDTAADLAKMIEEELSSIFVQNKDLIGPYQEDVYPLVYLKIYK